MFNVNFVDDWIRTADLWYWKQLSHTTALASDYFCYIENTYLVSIFRGKIYFRNKT